MDLSQFLMLLKQYGPLVAALLAIIYFQTRRIDHLLDRNEQIYETHIRNLWEMQKILMTKLLGPQQSSDAFPTVDDLKKNASSVKDGQSKSLGEGAGT